MICKYVPHIKLTYHDGHIEYWRGESVLCTANFLRITVSKNVYLIWKKKAMYKISRVDVVKRAICVS